MVVLPDMYGNVCLWTSLAVGLSMLYTTSCLHTCQVSVFVTPAQVFIPVPCYTSFRYLRGHRACFLLAAWTRTIPIFSSPICNTIWKSKTKITVTDGKHCDTDYVLLIPLPPFCSIPIYSTQVPLSFISSSSFQTSFLLEQIIIMILDKKKCTYRTRNG